MVPGNGLFEPLLRRASEARVWEIVWKPAATSHSFHGRDIFAPVAARLHREGPDALVRQGWLAPIDPAALRYVEWPDDLPRIVYVDRYGNAMTGLRGDRLPISAKIRLKDGTTIPFARTFGVVPAGKPLWYVNSNGLAEIAVNQGAAGVLLNLSPGSPVTVVSDDT